MKLFVFDKKNPKDKIYLSYNANSRFELSSKIGSSFFIINGMYYNINDVNAETEGGDTIFGALAGGILGGMTGGAGFIIGALGGLFLGNGRDNGKKAKAKIFNSEKATI